MTGKSTLDPDNLVEEEQPPAPKGHDTGSLGPSDSSDSGSDMIGTGELAESDSDRYGTGEQVSARKSRVRPDSDLGVDRIVDAEEAGLGAGLDQAEEAQLGMTDEELEAEAAGRGGRRRN